MSDVETFEDLANEISSRTVRQKLRELYGHPGNIDVWVGGILEDQLPDAKVGPLFKCLLLDQFKRMRNGDRFWYENPSSWRPEQLTQIKQASLARIMCDNGDNITRIQPNVFLLPDDHSGYVSCEDIPKIDLRMWADCCEDCEDEGNTFSRNRRSAKKYSKQKNLNTVRSDYQNEDKNYKEEIKILENEVEAMKEKIEALSKELRLLREKDL